MNFFKNFFKKETFSFQILEGYYKKKEAIGILNGTEKTLPSLSDFKRIKSFGYFWGLEDGKVEMFYISNQTSFKCKKPDLKKAKIILLEKNHTDL
jgi:hypothetical protein